jgi:hypothetical protein
MQYDSLQPQAVTVQFPVALALQLLLSGIVQPAAAAVATLRQACVRWQRVLLVKIYI